MNYIGSKTKLLPFIEEVIQKYTTLEDKVFCDLFAGTGTVGYYFKDKCKIIANDLEVYSFVLNKMYMSNTISNIELKDVPLVLRKGFISEHYSDVSSKRKYFSENNGLMIDSLRESISNYVDEEFYYLLGTLLEKADKVANTASIYGAYLKELKTTALKDIDLTPIEIKRSSYLNEVYNADANILINEIQGDILYLDPPYNERQYSANYHILNTIALQDTFIPKGITGLREYNKSKYCTQKVHQSFYNLIKNAKFKYIFVSYNNEGLMSPSDIRRTLSRFGEYHLHKKEYQRFKADSSRNHTADSVTEYIHVLIKD